jgi:ribosome recycling factor
VWGLFLHSLTSIEKALVKSDIGITPNNDGTVIRLNVPQLTADRRKVHNIFIHYSVVASDEV